MEQLGLHWMDFHKIWYLNIFQESAEKIIVLLRSDKNNGYFIGGPMYIYDNISLNSSNNEKFFEINVVEKNQNSPFMVNNIFLKVMQFVR